MQKSASAKTPMKNSASKSACASVRIIFFRAFWKLFRTFLACTLYNDSQLLLPGPLLLPETHMAAQLSSSLSPIYLH